MEKDLHKRLEEAAEDYIERNYKDSIAPDWNEKDFLAGAEYGYKEAIAVAKEWLEDNAHDYSFSNEGCDALLGDFEHNMNKLWEDKK